MTLFARKPTPDPIERLERRVAVIERQIASALEMSGADDSRQFRHDETARAHYVADHADELRDRDRPGK